jgi:hypothetical protein
MIRFIDTACVNPEVFYIVSLSLFAAKLNLSKASLLLERRVFEIIKIDLISIITPSVREYYVGRNVFEKISGDAQLPSSVKLQKAHFVDADLRRYEINRGDSSDS